MTQFEPGPLALCGNTLLTELPGQYLAWPLSFIYVGKAAPAAQDGYLHEPQPYGKHEMKENSSVDEIYIHVIL